MIETFLNKIIHMELKILTLILAFLMLNYTHGQNTGPNAPEAMAFEPVDATDMVNLFTGDFTYNIPIINIPGPSGGYPLSISYHSGITIDQEASWVGLGWSLNVGAINRNINGQADDYKNLNIIESVSKSNIATISNSFIDLSAPFSKTGITNLGVHYQWGSNRGFGGSVQFGVGNNSPLSVYGGFDINTGSASLSSGIGDKRFGKAMISINTDGDINASISNSQSMLSLDFSLTSEKSSVGVSVQGQSFFSSSSKDDKILYNVLSSWAYTIPTPWVDITFGHNKTSFNYNNITEKTVNGVLYAPNSYKNEDEVNYPGWQDPDFLMDSKTENYEMYYLGIDEYNNYYSNSKNNIVTPAYDSYSVSAQGLNGSISPKFYTDGILLGESQELEKDKYDVYYHNFATSLNQLNKNYKDIYFYFTNELSSYLLTENNETKKRKITGKVVEWFTNTDIRNDIAKSKGFIEEKDIFEERRKNDSNGSFDNTFFDPNGIGGFMITDSDGKTYHYSIPVYQFESYLIKEGGLDENDIFIFENRNKYAYSWLLTAITGPDYIDSNENGQVDDYDFGYWVNFNYGKWADSYFWQLPFNEKAEEFFNNGFKQIYYLDYVETKTHKAYFIKSGRLDGKSKIKSNEYSVITGGDSFILRDKHLCNYTNCDDNTKIITQMNLCSCEEFNECIESNNQYCWTLMSSLDQDERRITLRYNISNKTQVLKLDKIILLKKPTTIDKSSDENYEPINIGTLDSEDKITFGFINKQGYYDIDYKDHIVDITGSDEFPFSVCKEEPNRIIGSSMYYNSIIDINDVSSQMVNKALKIVEFNYDYSLCPSTPNSDASNGGKLTLKSINIKGIGGQSVLPPFLFNYSQNNISDFDLDRKDDWGFDAINPENWSLKEVLSPIGSKMEIYYEPNTYSKETSVNELNYYFSGYKIPSLTNNLYEAKFAIKIPDCYSIDEIFDNAISFEVKGVFKMDKHHYVKNMWGTWVCDEDPTYEFKNFYYDLSPETLNKTERTITFSFSYNADKQSGDYWGSTWDRYDIININSYSLKIETSNSSIKGGGVRTTKINLFENNSGLSKTYEYYGGVTSYAPGRANNFFIPYLNFQPGPQVIYKSVVENETNLNGEKIKTIEYTFKVPQSTENKNELEYKHGDILTITDLKDVNLNDNYSNTDLPISEITGNHEGKIFSRTTVIDDYLSTIGRIENKILKNKNEEVIESTEFIYSPNDAYLPLNSTIGKNSECFQSLKRYIEWFDGKTTSKSIWHFNSTSIVQHPNILKYLTVKNKSGINYQYFQKFDILTGNPIEVINHSNNGEELKTITIPAYTITNYAGASSDDFANIGMGSKVDNIYNKNMLTQEAASISYKKIDEEWKPLSASIQTWKGDWNNYVEWDNNTSNLIYDGTDGEGTSVLGYMMDPETGELGNPIISYYDRTLWRKHKTFAWQGDLESDGTYADFTSYDTPEKLQTNFAGWANTDHSGTGDNTNGWKMTSEVVRYNHYSSPLEVKDINGDFAASKKDPDHIYTTASAANASYTSFGATSFEYSKVHFTNGIYYLFEGEVISHAEIPVKVSYDELATETQMITGIVAHTGDKYGYITPGVVGCRYTGAQSAQAELIRGCDYRAAVWVHKNSPGSLNLHATVDGTTFTNETYIGQYGDWRLFYLDFNVPATATSFTVWADATTADIYIDDFRVAPFESALTTYTYDHAGQVTAIINNDNFATKYEYDAGGRLTGIFRETKKGFERVSGYEYNYSKAFTIVEGSGNYDSRFYFSNTNIHYLGGKMIFSINNLKHDAWTYTLPTWVQLVSKGDNFMEVNISTNAYSNSRTSGITITNSRTHVVSNITLNQLCNTQTGNYEFTNIYQDITTGRVYADIVCTNDNTIVIHVFCQYLAGAEFIIGNKYHRTFDPDANTHEFTKDFSFDVKKGDIIKCQANLWGNSQTGSQSAEIEITSIVESIGVEIGTTRKIDANWGN